MPDVLSVSIIIYQDLFLFVVYVILKKTSKITK